MHPPILQTHQLTFGFQKDQPIVSNLNLTVEKGAIYGFLGPNGAGKTTTIRLLLGLLPSQENSIQIFGKTLAESRQNIFGRIGSLIEMPSLYEHLTGWDNLEITRRLKNAGNQRIGQVLEQVRLSHAAQKKVKAYSLGMKQRLGLAIALLSEPELLILDEPTNGLDPNGMIETRELLLQLNREAGTTIFLSSHLLSEIEKMVTHVGIIHKGQMVFQGTTEQLAELKSNQAMLKIETSNNARAYELLQAHHAVQMNGVSLKTTFQSKQQAAQINKFLIQNDIDVYQLSVSQADLEQVFLQMTE
jgi:ABC-2 type transport system ATP-binding protein